MDEQVNARMSMWMCEGSMPSQLTGDVSKLEQMLEKGSDPNQRDYYACTPLHGACALGNQDAADLLIKAGAQPNMADRSALTLHACLPV